MNEFDAAVLAEIETAIRNGLSSRSELSMAAGVSRTRFDRIASAGIRAKKLRMAGRDKWGGMRFELAGQPSELVAEVVA